MKSYIIKSLKNHKTPETEEVTAEILWYRDNYYYRIVYFIIVSSIFYLYTYIFYDVFFVVVMSLDAHRGNALIPFPCVMELKTVQMALTRLNVPGNHWMLQSRFEINSVNFKIFWGISLLYFNYGFLECFTFYIYWMYKIFQV